MVLPVVVDQQAKYSLILYASKDGGKSWQPLSLGTETITGPWAISFSDPQHGWVLTLGRIFRTSDGGKTWTTLRTDLLSADSIRTLDFISPTTGWLVVQKDGETYLLQTTNGGESWTDLRASVSSPSTGQLRIPSPSDLRPLGPNAAAEISNLLPTFVPRLYPGTDHLDWKLSALVPLTTKSVSVWYGMAKNFGYRQLAQNSYLVWLKFPRLLPSADLSQGQFFITRTRSGWVAWFQYH